MEIKESTTNIIRDDEPTSNDRLNREHYAKAFAQLSSSCKTPMVIGIYGSWGVGKTSLMKLTERFLDTDKIISIWFDPWQHQFDENPIVSLAHTLVQTLGKNVKEEGKKILAVISAAFGSTIFKSITGLSAKDILQFGKIYEEERFQVREARVLLKEHFEKLVEKVKKSGSKSRRIVFFIDDLDRCMPDEALKLLEALKLYLNFEDCVYFLGVDRFALEQSIKHRYKGLEMNEADYLEKIVQLPFTVPPIEPQCLDSFIEPLLSNALQECRELLIEGLSDNPRQVKRFINTLTLNHNLSISLNIPKYRPNILALLLLIQLTTPNLYRVISYNPSLLLSLKQNSDDTKELFDEFLATNERLRTAIGKVELPELEELKTYIYLTRAASVTKDFSSNQLDKEMQSEVEKHTVWVESKGERGEKANFRKKDLQNIFLSNIDLRMADFEGANLQQAKLNGAYFGLANFRDADLKHANLHQAGLRGAIMTNADLSGADLSNADLRMINFHNANLSGANLSNTNITRKQLKSCIIDHRTILPDI